MHDKVFLWGPFTFFALVNSVTPGPNVILLASSGGAWGLKRTFPHLLGICFGFPVMLLLVLYGSNQVFELFPWLFSVLTVLSLLYVLWLSIRVFRMGFDSKLKLKAKARPMSFFEAASFQWINGKAWQIALMTATLYETSNHLTRFMEALIVGCVTFLAGIFWIELGKRIAEFLKHPRIRKIYFTALALALLLSTWPTGIARLLER